VRAVSVERTLPVGAWCPLLAGVGALPGPSLSPDSTRGSCSVGLCTARCLGVHGRRAGHRLRVLFRERAGARVCTLWPTARTCAPPVPLPRTIVTFATHPVPLPSHSPEDTQCRTPLAGCTQRRWSPLHFPLVSRCLCRSLCGCAPAGHRPPTRSTLPPGPLPSATHMQPPGRPVPRVSTDAVEVSMTRAGARCASSVTLGDLWVRCACTAPRSGG